MTDVFVIRNQLGHYWAKSKAWVDGRDARIVLRVKHHDEAINTLFELSAKDVELRGDIVEVELDDKGRPVIEPGNIPLSSNEEVTVAELPEVGAEAVVPATSEASASA